MNDLQEVLESIHNTIAFDCRDWGADSRSAWIYGIVCGWDDKSYEEFTMRFQWSHDYIARNKRLHSAVDKVRMAK